MSPMKNLSDPVPPKRMNIILSESQEFVVQKYPISCGRVNSTNYSILFKKKGLRRDYVFDCFICRTCTLNLVRKYKKLYLTTEKQSIINYSTLPPQSHPQKTFLVLVMSVSNSFTQ